MCQAGYITASQQRFCLPSQDSSTFDQEDPANCQGKDTCGPEGWVGDLPSGLLLGYVKVLGQPRCKRYLHVITLKTPSCQPQVDSSCWVRSVHWAHRASPFGCLPGLIRAFREDGPRAVPALFPGSETEAMFVQTGCLLMRLNISDRLLRCSDS